MYFPITAMSRYLYAAVGVPNYMAIATNTSNNWDTTEANVAQTVPIAMQLSNLTVQAGNPGNGQSVTFTVRKNGADTALSVIITPQNTTVSLTNVIVNFNAGDTIDLAAYPTTSAALQSHLFINMLGSAASQVIFASDHGNGSGDTLDNTSVSYGSMMGGASWNNYTNTPYFMIVPCAGTISNLYINAQVAPGGSSSYVIAVNINNSASSLAATVSGSALTGNDTTHSVSVVAGDIIAFQCTPSSTPTMTAISASWTFTPTTAGNCIVGMSGILQPGVSVYMPIGDAAPFGVSGSGLSNEINFVMSPYPGIISNFYTYCGIAPGGSASVIFMLRKNLADSSLTTTHTGSTTKSSSSITPVPISLGDLVCIETTPVSSPASSSAGFSTSFCFNFITDKGFYMPF